MGVYAKADGIIIPPNYNNPVFSTPNIGVATGTSYSLTAFSKINLNSASAPSPPSGAILHLIQADGVTPLLALDGFVASPSYAGRRAFGTGASPSALPSGATLVRLQGYGYGSTGYVAVAGGSVVVTTDEAWTDTANGTRIAFFTTNNTTAASTISEKMRITNSGMALIGYTADQDAAQLLQINGITYSSGRSFKSSNPTPSSCGTSPSVDSRSSNASGTVTVGSVAASGCTITFASAFTTFNHCTVTSQNSVAAFAYSYTLSAITVTATSMVSDKLDYQCDGV